MKRSAFLSVVLLLLSQTIASAEPLTLVTLGDSLTDTYVGKPYTAPGQMSWTDLLITSRSASVKVTNLAKASATSGDLIAQGQHTTAATLGAQGDSQYAALIIGANDIDKALQAALAQGPSAIDPILQELAANIYTSVATMQGAGLKVVVGNVPDIGATPYVKGLVGNDPVVLGLITQMTVGVNTHIEALAAQLGVPVIDLYKLNNISQQSFSISGQVVNTHLLGPDNFHPSSLGQALVANTVLEALHQGYGANTKSIQFSDSEILALAGLQPNGASGSESFDAATYVKVHNTPEPTGVVLLTIGAVGLFGMRRRVLRRARPLVCCDKP